MSTARRAEPMPVRVIDYTIDDGRDNSETYRLLTTLTVPDQASAEQLAAGYTQRWEIELAFDELRTHRGARGTHGPQRGVDRRPHDPEQPRPVSALRARRNEPTGPAQL